MGDHEPGDVALLELHPERRHSRHAGADDRRHGDLTDDGDVLHGLTDERGWNDDAYLHDLAVAELLLGLDLAVDEDVSNAMGRPFDRRDGADALTQVDVGAVGVV